MLKCYLQWYIIFLFSVQCEEEIKGYTRRIQLLEDDLDRTQQKLEEALTKLEDATKTADESERYAQPLHHTIGINMVKYAAIGKYKRLVKELIHVC